MEIEHWRTLIQACEKYSVYPPFAYAVCFTESGFNPHMSGNRNTIIGMMGIHHSFAKKFNVNLKNPHENIPVGVRALSLYEGDEFDILSNYNTDLCSRKDPYYKRVMNIKREAEANLKIPDFFLKGKSKQK